MESQPQNPEFRINPENFHPCGHDFSDPHLLSMLVLWTEKYLHFQSKPFMNL